MLLDKLSKRRETREEELSKKRERQWRSEDSSKKLRRRDISLLSESKSHGLRDHIMRNLEEMKVDNHH